MKAIVVREFGSPAVMKIEETAVLPPGRGEVLVRIHSAGVNPVDAYRVSGNYGKIPLSFTPGSDGAGIVEKTGDGVKALSDGDRVYFWQAITGTFIQGTSTFTEL